MSDSGIEIKKTPLHDIHVALGAKMVDFAGFSMPLLYKSIIDEHRAVRESVGVFDLTHMGEFIVTGPQSLEFLNYMTTNNVTKLKPFQVQYSAMLYEDGGIVDDLLVYRFPDHYMMVVNAANIAKDYEWILEHQSKVVQVENVSDRMVLIAIQGPDSHNLMKKITDTNLDEIGYYHFTMGAVDGTEMIISRTGYTGEDGFELYTDPEHGEQTWKRVMDAGREFGVMPVGLGARDTLRLEMKYALYGNDIDAGTNPFEAGLGWIVKMKKGDFIGRDALLKIKQDKIHRKLVGFIVKDKGIPRPGCEIIDDTEAPIGCVRSGGFSPSLNVGIGTGYIPAELADPDRHIMIDIRGKLHHAVIVKPPFYQSPSHR
jgi:aminomethyltransferase